MSLKTSILATVGLILLGCGGGLGYLATLSARQAEKVAEPLGGAVAVVLGLGIAAIWLPWAWKRGQAKRAAAARSAATPRKRPERRGRSGR